MPNWVRNRLVAMGTAEQIRDFGDRTTTKAVGSPRTIDFNKIIPAPPIYDRDLFDCEEDIVRVTAHMLLSGKSTSKLENYDTLLQDAASYLNCSAGDLILPPTAYKTLRRKLLQYQYHNGEMLAKNAYDVRNLGTQLLVAYHTYNTCDWHEWHCKYWGTKWNAVDCNISKSCNHGYDITTVSMTFDTASCEPTEVYYRIFQMFPDMQFDIVYANEEIGIGVGTITYDGYEARSFHYDNDSSLAMINAISLWDLWDYYEFDKETKQWIYNGEE